MPASMLASGWLSRRIAVYLAMLCLSRLAESAWGLAGTNGPRIGDVPPPLLLNKVLAGPPLAALQWER
jgi:hypothetical protein